MQHPTDNLVPDSDIWLTDVIDSLDERQEFVALMSKREDLQRPPSKADLVTLIIKLIRGICPLDVEDRVHLAYLLDMVSRRGWPTEHTPPC